MATPVFVLIVIRVVVIVVVRYGVQDFVDSTLLLIEAGVVICRYDIDMTKCIYW